MKLRKVLSALVLAIFMFSIVSPVMAQGEVAKTGQEQALKIAKETFDIPNSLKDVQISYREENYTVLRKVWEFSWNSSPYGKWHHYRAEVDADTGEIISYYENEEWNQYKRPAKVKTKTECKAIAENLIKKLASSKFNELKEKEIPDRDMYWYTNGPQRYRFVYERRINGIPFPENNINVEVNADNGKIMNYYSSWDSTLNFPTVEKSITPTDAEKIFRDKIGLQLTYLHPYNYSPVPIARNKPVNLYYSTWDYSGPAGMIDAATGKIIDQYGKEVNVQQKVYLPLKTDSTPITAEHKALTLDEAKTRVKEYISIPGDLKLQSSRYSENWGPGNQKTWEFQYGPDGYGGGNSLNVNIHADTGDLVSFNRWDGDPWGQKDRKVSFDYDKCRKIAVDFLKKVAPQKADYTQLYDNPVQKAYYNGKMSDPPMYNFNFRRIVNGIPFNMNSINVEVDNSTGEVRGFWSNWDQALKFVEPDSAVTEKEAFDKLIEVEKPNLVYVRTQKEDGMPQKYVILVYTMFTDVPKVVDAISGKVISSNELETPVVLEDIRGHWAEREIRALSSWGIVAGSNKKFNPDKPITRAEFVNMLALAKGLETDNQVSQTFKDVPKTSWYFGAVEAAAKAGLIIGSGGKFNPNKTITRQEMVVMLIKSMNGNGQQDKSGELQGKFKDEDRIASWASNSVIKAVEMGILAGQNGYLKPGSPATRAEAVVMLMKLLAADEKFGRYASRAVYG